VKLFLHGRYSLSTSAYVQGLQALYEQRAESLSVQLLGMNRQRSGSQFVDKMYLQAWRSHVPGTTEAGYAFPVGLACRKITREGIQEMPVIFDLPAVRITTYA